MSETVKAWRVVWSGTPNEPGIYVASTAAKARALSFRLAEEAGYRPKWGDLRVRRAPEYDAWAARQDERRRRTGLIEEFVRREASAPGEPQP